MTKEEKTDILNAINSQIENTIKNIFEQIEDNIAIKVYARITGENPHVLSILDKELINSADTQKILGVGRTRLCQLRKRYPEIICGKKYRYKEVLKLSKVRKLYKKSP